MNSVCLLIAGTIFITDISTVYDNCTNGDIRLVGSDGEVMENEGRVEVCINHAWGTVCDYLFDGNDVNVVCTQLGITPGGELNYKIILYSQCFSANIKCASYKTW